MFQAFFTKKFLDDFGTTSCFMYCYKIWNTRRYHGIAWEKIICIICIYLPETDSFIGVRMFHTVHYSEFPCVQGNNLIITLGFFIKYCTLIFSLVLLRTNTNTLVLPHTQTQTHTHTITEASIFTFGLLSLETRV